MKHISVIVIVASLILLPAFAYRAQNQTDFDMVSVVWSPDGNRIAASGTHGIVAIWNMKQYAPAIKLRLDVQIVQSISWSADGSMIASLSSEDGIIRIWDSTNGRLLTSFKRDSDPMGRAIVAWSPDNTRIASIICSDNGASVQIWQDNNGRFQLVSTSDEFSAYDMAWSKDGKKLAVTSLNKGLVIFDDVLSAKLTGRFLWGESPITIAWSPNDAEIAASDPGGSIHIISADAGKERAAFKKHQGTVDAIDWSPDGTQIASSGLDNAIYVWESTTGALTASFVRIKSEASLGRSVAWNRFSRILVYLGEVSNQYSGTTIGAVEGNLQIALVSPVSKNNLQSTLELRRLPREPILYTWSSVRNLFRYGVPDNFQHLLGFVTINLDENTTVYGSTPLDTVSSIKAKISLAASSLIFVSPSGRYLVYIAKYISTLVVQDMQKGRSWLTGIRLPVNLSDSEPQFQLIWSPDESVVWVNRGDGFGEFLFLNEKGVDSIFLRDFKSHSSEDVYIDHIFARPSQQKQAIVFGRVEDHSNSTWLVDLQTMKGTLIPIPDILDAAFSPDGKSIYLALKTGFGRLNPDLKTVTFVDSLLSAPINLYHVSLSPNLEYALLTLGSSESNTFWLYKLPNDH